LNIDDIRQAFDRDGFAVVKDILGPDDWVNERRVALSPGHAIAHHCMTIHRADANESDKRDRVAMVMIYQGESARVDEAWRARHLENVRRQQENLGRKATAGNS